MKPYGKKTKAELIREIESLRAEKGAEEISSDGDYLLNPETKYNFSDHIRAALGGTVFGNGEKWSQFGQLDKNDNIYAQIRYEF